MIRKKDECRKEIREQMRGGDGQVLITHIFEKDELLGRSRMFSSLTLEPGCSVGAHGHENEQEYFYVVKGSPLYCDDDEKIRLQEGDGTICEDGHSHAIINDTDETVVMIACILLK